MPAQAWVPLIATEVALLLTLALGRRALLARRPHLVAWTVSLGCFTAGAGALWYGTAFGWSGPTFRTYYLFGALLAVPLLALGQLLLQLGRRGGELAMALTVVFCVVAGYVVVLAPFQRGARVTGAALPDGGSVYGPLVRALVGVSNGAGTLIVLGGVGVSVWRQRRAGPAARARALGLTLIALGVLAAGAGGALTFLGAVSANALGLLVGVCALYLGFLQSGRRIRIGRHRET